MASANFENCLRMTLAFEGGYSDHPKDPGGATNFGVTQATLSAFRGYRVSKTAVRSLSRGDAATIYRRKFWDVVRGEDLPAGIDAAVFDHAVNSGPRAAIIALQKALVVEPDGRMGERTLAAARRADPGLTIARLCLARRSFLSRLRTFQIFGRGWLRRVAAVEQQALAML